MLNCVFELLASSSPHFTNELWNKYYVKIWNKFLSCNDSLQKVLQIKSPLHASTFDMVISSLCQCFILSVAHVLSMVMWKRFVHEVCLPHFSVCLCCCQHFTFVSLCMCGFVFSKIKELEEELHAVSSSLRSLEISDSKVLCAYVLPFVFALTASVDCMNGLSTIFVAISLKSVLWWWLFTYL